MTTCLVPPVWKRVTALLAMGLYIRWIESVAHLITDTNEAIRLHSEVGKRDRGRIEATANESIPGQRWRMTGARGIEGSAHSAESCTFSTNWILQEGGF